MPIFYLPSSALTGQNKNVPSMQYAHPGHSTMGILRKGPDPRSRVRRKTREERVAEREAAAKKRTEAAAAGAERTASRKKLASQRRRDVARMEFESNPEAMRMERLRQQTQAQAAARRAEVAGGVKRLTTAEQAARMEDLANTNRIRNAPLPFGNQMGPDKPEAPVAMTPISEVFGGQKNTPKTGGVQNPTASSQIGQYEPDTVYEPSYLSAQRYAEGDRAFSTRMAKRNRKIEEAANRVSQNQSRFRNIMDTYQNQMADYDNQILSGLADVPAAGQRIRDAAIRQAPSFALPFVDLLPRLR